MSVSSTSSSSSSSTRSSSSSVSGSDGAQGTRSVEKSTPASETASSSKVAEASPVEARAEVDPARQADSRRNAAMAGADLQSRLSAQVDSRKSGVAPNGLRSEVAMEAARNQNRPGVATNGLRSERAVEVAAAGPNAVLNDLQTNGMGADTARASGLQPGVNASHTVAASDLERLQGLEQTFVDVARERDLPPAVLAAIASRESNAGAALDANGWGDRRNGFGIMQVDRNSHTPVGGPTSRQHIEQAADILRGYLDDVREAHPDWSAAQQMRGAIAAYNFGPSNVQTLGGIDRGTTGNDYSSDVWARAQYLMTQGFGSTNP